MSTFMWLYATSRPKRLSQHTVLISEHECFCRHVVSFVCHILRFTWEELEDSGHCLLSTSLLSVSLFSLYTDVASGRLFSSLAGGRTAPSQRLRLLCTPGFSSSSPSVSTRWRISWAGGLCGRGRAFRRRTRKNHLGSAVAETSAETEWMKWTSVGLRISEMIAMTRCFKSISDAICQVTVAVHHWLFPTVSHSYYGYTQKFYGPDIAAAYYVLSMEGGFR